MQSNISVLPKQARLLPQDTDAEDVALSIMLRRPDSAIPVALEYGITSASFFQEPARETWKAILAQYNAGTAITLQSTQSWFEGRPNEQWQTLRDYVKSIEHTGNAFDGLLDRTFGTLREKEGRRLFIELGPKWAEDAYDRTIDLSRIADAVQRAAERAQFDPKRHALDYATAVLSAPLLAKLQVPSRKPLLGGWMQSGDFGIVFAPRGVGKSWIAMLLGLSIASGVRMGEWIAGEACPVLYVDGEMMLADSQWRQRMTGCAPESFRWLHHERVAQVLGKRLNIALPECQNAISRLVPDNSVVILDNLSALCRGVEENGNDDWEIILDWLLDLRRRGVTVILVHHAGKNGEMRGGSRREDHADWIIKLKDNTDDSERQKSIVSMFVKSRGVAPAATLPMRWTLNIDGSGLAYECRPFAGPDALLAIIESGVEVPGECAEALNVPACTISRWAKRLEKEGKINITNRRYLPCGS